MGRSKKRLTVIIALTMCLFSLSLAGCSREKENIKVDLIIKSTDSEFWRSLYKGATAAAQKYEIELTFLGPKEESQYQEQVAIFEQSLKKNPDAIILAAGDYYLMSEPVSRADLPIIMVDSLVQGDNWDTFIETDNYMVGVQLAKEVIGRYGKTGKVGVINFIKNTSTAIDRNKGFVDTIDKESDLEIVDTLYCEAYIDIAKRQTRKILKEHPDINVLVGLNAQSTIGIARVIEERKDLESTIFVAGVDCVVEEANYIEKDIIEVCILQNPYMMGYYCVENAYALIQGVEVEKNITVDTYVIDKESLFDQESQELIFPFE